MRDAAGRRSDLARLDVDVEARQLAHRGQRGHGRVELDGVGEEDPVADLDLGGMQAPDVDYRWVLAALARDDRDRADRARPVQELAQEDDDRVERPDGGDDLGGVVLTGHARQDRRAGEPEASGFLGPGTRDREPRREEPVMGDGTTDDLKGRAKEAAGDVTDDDGLEEQDATEPGTT